MAGHSPTPWHKSDLGQGLRDLIVDADNQPVCVMQQVDRNEVIDTAHIIRCVNAYDQLVNALLFIRNYALKRDFLIEIQPIIDAAEIALDAAGEQPITEGALERLMLHAPVVKALVAALREIARLYDDEMSVGFESATAEEMADSAKHALKALAEGGQP